MTTVKNVLYYVPAKLNKESYEKHKKHTTRIRACALRKPIMYDEMLDNKITMIARIVYKVELSKLQLMYVKHCVGLMTSELDKHLGLAPFANHIRDMEPEMSCEGCEHQMICEGCKHQLPITKRESKIIESITASYISAVIKLVLMST